LGADCRPRGKAPPEETEKVPADGAAQIDHYLYGHPKRPE
jgi:hypothetical protein